MNDSNLIPTVEVHDSKIEIGLSACLAGDKVRYNGGHSHSSLCTKTLDEHFSFRKFCPESAAGFGTPRPTMQLTGNPEAPKLQYSSEKLREEADTLTPALQTAVNQALPAMGDLDGYILMKNSPSCGLERIKVYQDNGYPHQKRVRGLFTHALMEQYPTLPVEEEGRLHDPRLKENFILRVYAHHEFRTQVLLEPSVNKLMAFHSSYKYILMAHGQKTCKSLGQLVSASRKDSIKQDVQNYFCQFMSTLAKPASSKNHTNVLLHILGYLKKNVPSKARQNIVDVIAMYRLGQLPLVTPMTLLKHYIEQYGSDYIREQKYLRPYPESLGLTNRL